MIRISFVALLAVAFVLTGCQTTQTSATGESPAARFVRIFEERCLDYVLVPDLRLERLAEADRRRDGVVDITDRVKPSSIIGESVRFYAIENADLLKVTGSPIGTCFARTLEPTRVTLDEVIKAYQARTEIQFFSYAQGGELTIFKIARHQTNVTGTPEYLSALIAFYQEGESVGIGLSGWENVD